MVDPVQMDFFEPLAAPESKGWFAAALSCLGMKEAGGWPDSFGDALRRWNADAKPKPVTALSLFSGAGGLDIGFHDAGFAVLECNEIERDFAETLRRNAAAGGRLTGANVVREDIHRYTPGVGSVDFIIGGPPCQTFSAAGARAAGVNGTDDDRGNLFLQYARIIDHAKPTGFLFENVYRIVGAQSGKPWKRIQAAFQELGYKLFWRILDAADYGVPQFRERLIIVGLKRGCYRFPFPSHGPDSPDRRDYYSAKQAVSGIDTSGCKTGIGGRHGHLLNDIPPGLNYSFYTERMGHPKPLFGWRSKFSDYLYKADPDTPVRTIKAQGGQYTGPFSWENRPFTIGELKRLQTFPDDYVIEGGRQKAIHQLGNSVPPQMARILALGVLGQVFGRNLPFPLQYMADGQRLGFRARKSSLTAVYAKKAAATISKMPKHAVEIRKLREGSEYISVTSDFRIELNEPKESEYRATHVLAPDAWTVCVHDNLRLGADDCFAIKIVPPIRVHGGPPAASNLAEARLISYAEAPKSLLALWKYYERLVQRHAGKDDLVQLLGYYQYKIAFSLSMTLNDPSLQASPFWQTARQVTMGCGIGKISPVGEVAALYGLAEGDFIRALSQLKELGYEIRNHRTNQQIPQGHILIPYAFPSLNERSLQRLTRL